MPRNWLLFTLALTPPIAESLLVSHSCGPLGVAFALQQRQRWPSRGSATVPTTTCSASRRLQRLRSVNNGETELDQVLENGDLQSAIRLLQERANYRELNRTQWDRIFAAIEERTAHADENTENLRLLAEFPIQSAARQEMTELYNVLRQQNHLTLFGAIDVKKPLAAGSHNVPPSLLEQILDLPMSALTPKPTNTLLLAGGAVALLEAAVAAFTGIPLNVLAFLTVLIAVVDRLFVNGAVLESLLKILSPGTQAKIVRHEAGHFLAAYLLGCPVEGIVLSAWAALQDRRFGTRQVSAGTSFFDPQLSQQINTQSRVTRSSIDRYSIIVMAGIAAEADFYGRADGGAGDEMALVAFLSQLNAGSKGKTWNSDSIRNQARWGALQAVLLLRHYKEAYAALVDALERGGTLGDCIYAIERAARESNLDVMSRPLGWIVEDLTQPSWTTEDPTRQAINSGEPLLVNKPFDEDKSLEELKEYRDQIEQKLKTIEERLKEIED